MIAGIVYDYRYQGHTIEERWTSIVVTVILLSSSLAGPLLIHVGTLVDRCSWYMRQHKSVYDTASGTLATYATLGKPQPMPDSVQASVEFILAVCRSFSRALLSGSDST